MKDATAFDGGGCTGALSSGFLSKITGVPRSRLDGWHRRGIAEASVWRGDRTIPRIYAWRDYARIRAARQFLQRGVPPRGLRRVLDQLDSTIRDWHLLLRYDHRFIGIAPCDGDFKYGVPRIDPERTPQVAELGTLFASDGDALLIEVAEQLRDEGPLGRLKHFERWVDMRPEVQEGNPTIKGSRIETAAIAGYAGTGMSVGEIAETLWIDGEQAAEALRFEDELASAER